MMDQRELFASRAVAFDIVLRGMMLSAWELNAPFSLLDRGVRGNGDDVAEITVHSWTVAGSDRDVVRVVYMVTSSARRVMLRWRNLPRRGEHVALPRRPPGDWSPRPGGWASANCGRYTFKAPTMSRWHARPPLSVQAGITDEQPGPEVFGAYDEDGEWGIPCPYGGPGDRLWVRETWRTGKSLDALNTTAMEKLCVDAGYTHPWAPLLYMADGTSTNDDTLLDFGSEWGRTRQSIYMPRWASRITLEVTDVRYERLQEITEKDATAEGIKRISKDGGTTWKWGLPDRDGLPGIDDDGMPWTDWDVDARVAFRNLWDRINGKRPGCSYGANPYVWAVSFKRIEMTL